jgi:crotonobetainyl-CoA:carnitine CoA-transferase CaiB-like acyl-CoA transferase
VLGLESLTTVPEFADNTKRLANRDALRELLNERFRTDTAIAWTRRLVEKGIPSGPIYALDQVFADPQVVHGGMVEEVAHATLGPIRLLSNPLRMDGFEEGKTVRLPPPEIGEHSRDILAAFGFTPGEIEGYVAEGVIGVRDGG